MKIHTLSFKFKFFVALACLAGSFVFSMLYGAAEINLKDIWSAASGSMDKNSLILRELRFPREIAALLVGSALAVAGAIMQGMTRNPLADPGLLGLTAGANAAIAIAYALFPSLNTFGIMIACFIGAGAGAVIVFGIAAAKRGGFSPFRLILAGAAVSAFFFAVSEGVGLSFKVSKDISMWTAGGVIGTTWSQIQIIAPVIVVGIVISIVLSKQLTLLSLSEDVAVGLGQRTTQIKIILFIVIFLLAGAAVALAGNIAFVGLMVPHIVRVFVGTDYRFILPMSAVAGGMFMVLADTFGRTISPPYEIPTAALISVLGLPFFLLIVKKGGRVLS